MTRSNESPPAPSRPSPPADASMDVLAAWDPSWAAAYRRMAGNPRTDGVLSGSRRRTRIYTPHES
jgi:hypothetical protein